MSWASRNGSNRDELIGGKPMAISAAEQYFLELVNAARLDPLAAAAKAGVALNQGLRPGAISAESKAVLAPQAILQMPPPITVPTCWRGISSTMSTLRAGR